MKPDKNDAEMSSGNVFEDLGLPGSDELLAKAELARQLASIISHRHLTQEEAARLLGTTQPKVSDLLHGKLAGFSMERLIRFLNALDRDVQIVVSPKTKTHLRGQLLVAASSQPTSPRVRARQPSTSPARGRRTRG